MMQTPPRLTFSPRADPCRWHDQAQRADVGHEAVKAGWYDRYAAGQYGKAAVDLMQDERREPIAMVLPDAAADDEYACVESHGKVVERAP